MVAGAEGAESASVVQRSYVRVSEEDAIQDYFEGRIKDGK